MLSLSEIMAHNGVNTHQYYRGGFRGQHNLFFKEPAISGYSCLIVRLLVSEELSSLLNLVEHQRRKTA